MTCAQADDGLLFVLFRQKSFTSGILCPVGRRQRRHGRRKTGSFRLRLNRRVLSLIWLPTARSSEANALPQFRFDGAI